MPCGCGCVVRCEVRSQLRRCLCAGPPTDRHHRGCRGNRRGSSGDVLGEVGGLRGSRRRPRGARGAMEEADGSELGMRRRSEARAPERGTNRAQQDPEHGAGDAHVVGEVGTYALRDSTHWRAGTCGSTWSVRCGRRPRTCAWHCTKSRYLGHPTAHAFGAGPRGCSASTPRAGRGPDGRRTRYSYGSPARRMAGA